MRCSVTFLMPKAALFGVSTPVSQVQRAAREALGNVSIAKAFPLIAAQWVSSCGKNELADPTNLVCLSPKKQQWLCGSCKGLFTKTVQRHVDGHGVCPLCGALPSARAATTTLSASARKSTARKQSYQRAYDVSPSLRKRSIDPMLAREWLDVLETNDFSNEILFASPKLDGIRCMVTYAPEVKRVLYISRRGSLLECCDSFDQHFLPLFEEDPSLMLDGELYTPLENFETLSSLVRTTTKGRTLDMMQRQKDLQFHAFDIMYSKLIPRPQCTWFPARHKILSELIPVPSTRRNAMHRASSPAFNALLTVPYSPMPQSKADAFLKKATANGYEGIMIRRDGQPYGYGKRSNALMKYKTFDSAEYVALDITEGVGRCKGQAGSILLKTSDGLTFNATPKSLGPLRAELWERRNDVIGKAITVQFQGKSAEGVPRFPVAISVRGAANGSDWF